MPIDFARHVGAVTREVESREHEGRMARVVRASRTYDTTIEDVWDALTNAERIPRWFLPVTGELGLGGHYQLEGNAGGEIAACEPRHLEHIAHVGDDLWDQFGPGAVGVGWTSSPFWGLGSISLPGRPSIRRKPPHGRRRRRASCS